MKTIIVPTDFSPTAANAMQYAIVLAREMDAEILLMHAFYPAMQLNTGYMIDPGIEDDRKFQLKQLAESFQEQVDANPANKVKITSKFIIGFPIEEIVDVSHQADTVIVMGATGDSGVMGRLFGSVASNVAKQAACPVYLIPPNAVFGPFRQMMYASDEPLLDIHMEHLVTPLVEKFGSRLHCVHVGKYERNYKEEDLKGIFQNLVDKQAIVRKNLDRVDVLSGLNEYAEQENIDLLILSTRTRSFWNRLVHVSITREMALQPKLPILVLHDVDKFSI